MKLLTNIKYLYLVLKQRYKAKSPVFFVQLKKIAVRIGLSCIAVISANATIPLTLPVGLITILSYIVAVCIAIAGTAQLTKE
jgi:hypothetical protein